MYRRKVITGIIALMMVAICMACGNGTASVETSETAVSAETVSDEGNTGTDEEVSTDVQEQSMAESEETDAAPEPEEETVEEEKQDDNKYRLSGRELEKIVQQYDEVLSNYDLECYFGYNKPDDGWEKLWNEWDGRQEEKDTDQLSKGNETLFIHGFEINPVEVVSVFDDNGNEVEVQADTYEYECRYNDEIREFCKTGEWKEPERCQNPYNKGMNYCIDRRLEGKIDTPYGEGTLYSVVYEYVGYEEHDDERACWTQIDESSRYWYRREGMILEIDEYFVQIELAASDDWYVWEGKSGERLLGIEYTGRLEELLHQMFETK